MDQAPQEGAGGDDDCPCPQQPAIGQPNTADSPVRHNQLVGLAFDHLETGGLADRSLHRGGIELAVGLGPGAADRGTLAAVEHAELDPAGIGHAAHQAVERIDLADQMTLAETADGGIAGHRADGGKAMRQQGRRGTRPRRRCRGFTAGMAAADDDDVKAVALCGHAGPLAQDDGRRKRKPLFHVKQRAPRLVHVKPADQPHAQCFT
jgi:hypothetical protein